MGDYIPQAPINDEARKHNENLPGMGGVYNYVNLHVYHYAGNNPVKLTDPDGRIFIWSLDGDATVADLQKAKAMGEEISKSDTEAGRRWRAIEESDKVVVINVHNGRYDKELGKYLSNDATPGNDKKWGLLDGISSVLGGSDAYINFNPNNTKLFSTNVSDDPIATLAHEIAHAYVMIFGKHFITRKNAEMDATAVENQFRALISNLDQRIQYTPGMKGYDFQVPFYGITTQKYWLNGKEYKLRK
jgi:hypothetical protein